MILSFLPALARLRVRLDETTCYPRSMLLSRITCRADQMGGAPCIRGLRIPVSVVVDMVADGMPTDAILALYPDLDEGDIPAALGFAAEAVREREPPPIVDR